MDICTELSLISGAVDALGLLNLGGCMEEITQQLDDWEGGNIQNLTHLNDKIKAVLARQTNALPPPGLELPVLTLPHNTIVDSNGVQRGVFDGVMSAISNLKAENSRIKTRLDAMQANLAAGGGVVFGCHTFTSEQHVMDVVMAECPQGDAFSLFIDPMSIFCHDGMYLPYAGWQKEMKEMERWGFMSKTACKVVASFDANNSWWYTEGKGGTPGLKLATFASAEKWSRAGGMIGRRDEIEASVQSASNPICGGIEHKLPIGGKLAQVATRMLERMNLWIHAVHKHLDEEL